MVASPLRPVRRRYVIAAGAIALVASGAYVQTKGGLSEFFQMPAQVGRATPEEQSGARVLGIARTSSNDPNPRLTFGDTVLSGSPGPIGSTRVWLQVPLDSGKIREDDLSVLCRLSTGETYRVGWELADLANGCLSVTIPPGYPERTEWMNLILRKKGEPDRTWKLVRLPKPRKVKITEGDQGASVAGIRIEAEARQNSEHAFGDFNGGFEPTGVLQLKVSGVAVQKFTYKKVILTDIATDWCGGDASRGAWEPTPLEVRGGETKDRTSFLYFPFIDLSKRLRVRGEVQTHDVPQREVTIRGAVALLAPHSPKAGSATVRFSGGKADLGNGKELILSPSIALMPIPNLRPNLEISCYAQIVKKGTQEVDLVEATRIIDAWRRIRIPIANNVGDSIALPPLSFILEEDHLVSRTPFSLAMAIGQPLPGDEKKYRSATRQSRIDLPVRGTSGNH